MTTKPAAPGRRSHFFDVASLRRRPIFQPLAVMLSILLAPVFPGNAPGPLAAQAQSGGPVVQGCRAMESSRSIVRDYCVDTAIYFNDLVQLEADAVRAYLGAHGLPESDASIIYDYGRTDLRNAIRGYMVKILTGIVTKPEAACPTESPAPTCRTTHERALAQWLETLVKANEIVLYTNAYQQVLSWQADPCRFQLDADVAKATGLSYNGRVYCGQSNSAIRDFILDAPMPAASYFVSYGIKKSYQSWSEKCSDSLNGFTNSCVTILEGTGANIANVAGASAAAGSLLTIAAGAALAQSLTLALAATGKGLAASNAAFVLSASTIKALPALVSAVPVAIILVAISIGISAGIQAFSYRASLDQLNSLSATLAQVTAGRPDLAEMALDPTAIGLFKLTNAVIGKTLHERTDGKLVDLPSTTPLPAHRTGTDLEFLAPNNTTFPTYVYRGWHGENWSASTWGGWFVQTCADGTPDAKNSAVCFQADSISADLTYIDHRWRGRAIGATNDDSRFSAARRGDRFISVRQGAPIVGAGPCPALPYQGNLSAPSALNFGACSSFVATEIPAVRGDGSSGFLEMTPRLSPFFSGATTLAFEPGIASTQSVQVTGKPGPLVCIVSSTLPATFTVRTNPSYALQPLSECTHGLTLGATNLSVEVAYNGAVASGTYSLKLRTANGFGIEDRTLSIVVEPTLRIWSANFMEVTAGQPASFQVVASGAPKPQISLDPLLASQMNGLTLTDHGNGTATISGIFTGGFSPNCQKISPPGPCGIIATNSQGTVEQQFEVRVSNAPQPLISGCEAVSISPQCKGTTFVGGAPNRLVLTAGGYTTPLVGWTLEPFNEQVPSWLRLVDQQDGTAILLGTPPAGLNQTFRLAIRVAAQYTGFTTAHFFPVTVVSPPTFTTSGPALFTVGANGEYEIAATAGSISTASAIPAGLVFTPGNPARIGGTPAVGSGGIYNVRLESASTTGTAVQDLMLVVNEGMKFASPNLAVVFAGRPARVEVVTTGTPSLSSHSVEPNAGPPTDPNKGDGAHFSVSGLPASLAASNRTVLGLATGTLVISGTPGPADVGTRRVQITAQNAVGSPAQQTLTLQILPYNPTAAVGLLGTWTLVREADGDVIVSVVLANNGTAEARNVKITAARIGMVNGTVFPPEADAIAPAGTSTFQVRFPAGTLGANGTPGVFSMSGTYTGGTFNNAGRIVLP